MAQGLHSLSQVMTAVICDRVEGEGYDIRAFARLEMVPQGVDNLIQWTDGQRIV